MQKGYFSKEKCWKKLLEHTDNVNQLQKSHWIEILGEDVKKKDEFPFEDDEEEGCRYLYIPDSSTKGNTQVNK